MYAKNIQAMNAARKEFGPNWKEVAEIRKQVDGTWIVELKEVEREAELALQRGIREAFDEANAEANARLAAGEPMSQAEAALALNKLSPDIDHFERLWELVSKAIEGDLWLDSLTETRKEIDAAYNAGAISMAQFTALCAHSAKLQDDKTDADIAAQAAQAEALANAQQATEIRNGREWVRLSSVEKPVKRVWHIADEMVKAALESGQPAPRRKEIEAECVRRGIASGTARTQYQAWKKANDAALENAAKAAELSAKYNGK